MIGIAFDADTGKAWLRYDGTWVGGGNPVTGANPTFTGMPAGTWHLYVAVDNTSAVHAITLNTGATTFQAPAPSGFSGRFAT
jgi:hypothetical protein